ncbi:MAG: 30S ribosomal protein S17 [Caldisericia bacterium]
MKKTLIGTVVSNKMQKTVVVKTEKIVTHSLYKKQIKRWSKFYAHSELPLSIGDIVEIEESRPLSKLKRWRVKRIIKRIEDKELEEENDQTLQ